MSQFPQIQANVARRIRFKSQLSHASNDDEGAEPEFDDEAKNVLLSQEFSSYSYWVLEKEILNMMSNIHTIFMSVHKLPKHGQMHRLLISLEKFSLQLPFVSMALKNLIEKLALDENDSAIMIKLTDNLSKKMPGILVLIEKTALQNHDISMESISSKLSDLAWTDTDALFCLIDNAEEFLLPMLEAAYPKYVKAFPRGERSIAHILNFIELCLLLN